MFVRQLIVKLIFIYPKKQQIIMILLILNKILINNKYDKKSIKRLDFITKAIMKIIDDEDLNVNLKWIKFEEFESGEKYIITGRKPDLEEDEINKLI